MPRVISIRLTYAAPTLSGCFSPSFGLCPRRTPIEAIERDSRKHVALSLARLRGAAAQPEIEAASGPAITAQQRRTNASLSANRSQLDQKGKLIGYRPAANGAKYCCRLCNLTALALVSPGCPLWSRPMEPMNLYSQLHHRSEDRPRGGNYLIYSEWSVKNGDSAARRSNPIRR